MSAFALRLNSFLPIRCASYQCSSASRIRPAFSRIRATPFIFPQIGAPNHLPLPESLYFVASFAASFVLSIALSIFSPAFSAGPFSGHALVARATADRAATMMMVRMIFMPLIMPGTRVLIKLAATVARDEEVRGEKLLVHRIVPAARAPQAFDAATAIA